jgi:L-fuculose-phosphate aldolase
VLLDALGHPIRLLTIDHAYYVREVRSTPFIQSGTQELADAGAGAVADGCNCVILGHHGCSVGRRHDRAGAQAAPPTSRRRRARRSRCCSSATPRRPCPPAYLETIRAGAAASRPGH